MPRFEDAKTPTDIERLVWRFARRVDFQQQKPWTYAKYEVVFSGVTFEGVGFARQRQYTSVDIRLKPFRVTLAQRDCWSSSYGEMLCEDRAIENLIVNVTRVWRKYRKGKLWLPDTGCTLETVSLPFDYGMESSERYPIPVLSGLSDNHGTVSEKN